MASASTHRSPERSAQVAFRISRADRDHLRVQAAAAGVTVQTYLERIVLGRTYAEDLPPGPTRAHTRQESLPMTG